MDGPIATRQRRLIRKFVQDRHSITLLAKAFEHITGDHTRDCSPDGSEQSSQFSQTQSQLLETSK